MPTLLYRQLASWYRLVDPVADHAPEAAAWQAAFERCVRPAASTLLELGCGAGHNAFHLKRRFSCCLTDLSAEMLDLSRALNPECEHLEGDMRTLRLGRAFDAVLLHDAVMYLTSEADLRAAVMTAFLHTRPGGAAIVAPDYVRETFREGSQLIEGDDGPRALRCVEWHWDPDENDETYVVEYAFLLRDREGTKVVHDRHTLGLFPRATWVRILEGAGYVIDPMAFTLRGPGRRVKRGAQGFALPRLSSVRFSEQGEALRSAPHLRRSLHQPVTREMWVKIRAEACAPALHSVGKDQG